MGMSFWGYLVINESIWITPKLLQFILRSVRTSVPNFKAIHPTVFERDEVVDWPTQQVERQTLPSEPLLWLKSYSLVLFQYFHGKAEEQRREKILKPSRRLRSTEVCTAHPFQSWGSFRRMILLTEHLLNAIPTQIKRKCVLMKCNIILTVSLSN